MTDEELRRLERERRASGDQTSDARHLRELVRQGRLAPERVEAAAAFGHPSAIDASDVPPSEDELAKRDLVEDVRALGKLGREACLRAEIALVRVSLGRWRSRFDGPEDELVETVELIEEWARTRTKAAAETVARAREALLQSQVYASWVFVVCRSVDDDPPSPEERAVELVDNLRWSFDPRFVRRWLRDDLGPWLLGTGDPLRERPRTHGRRFGREPDIVRALAFSADGARVLTTSHTGTVSLWRPVAGGVPCATLEHRLAELREDLFAAALSPDGRHAVVGGNSGTLTVFDLTTREKVAELSHGAERIDDLVFAGDRLVSAGYDGRAKVWDLSSRACLATLELHERSIASVATDGARLLTGSSDGTIRLTDLATGTRLASLETGGGSVVEAAFGKGEAIVAAVDRSVWVWDTPGAEPRKLPAHEFSVSACSVDARGELAAITAGEGGLAILSLATGEDVFRTNAFTGLPLAVTFAPDGRSVLVGERGGAIRSFEL